MKPTGLSFHMLKEITNDFSTKVGHGGYGEVLQGMIYICRVFFVELEPPQSENKYHVEYYKNGGLLRKQGVYNGRDVAVKKLYNMRGLDENIFKNELNSLMRVHHQNIVHLLGYCYE
jgi:hypothetical protein